MTTYTPPLPRTYATPLELLDSYLIAGLDEEASSTFKQALLTSVHDQLQRLSVYLYVNFNNRLAQPIPLADDEAVLRTFQFGAPVCVPTYDDNKAIVAPIVPTAITAAPITAPITIITLDAFPYKIEVDPSALSASTRMALTSISHNLMQKITARIDVTPTAATPLCVQLYPYLSTASLRMAHALARETPLITAHVTLGISAYQLKKKS
jgi:hypothetical protein